MHGAAADFAGSAGTAVVPGCNDVLVGIPAERALAVEDQTDVVYVSRGICEGETTPTDLVVCLRRG